MAKYDITHTCGHTSIYNIVGKVADRDGKVSWLESKPCRDCERRAENEKAAATNSASGLPALTGSEKQIAWAESIRAEKAQSLTDMRAKLAPHAGDAQADAAIAVIDAQLTETAASAWIDARSIAFDLCWLRAQIAA